MIQELFEKLRINDVTVTAQEIGRGAYATVLQVRWRGIVCAGKKVHRILVEDVGDGGMNKVVEGFVKECQTWSTLRHPHIVQFLGLFFEPGFDVPVIVMEKMDISLRGLLENRNHQRFPLSHKINILHQVALGLLYLHAHSSQLVHRDLTANNILLDLSNMRAKITDFGLVKCMDAVRAGEPLTEVPGVIAYMGPEAFQRPPQYSVKLDVFSFGVLVIHTVVHVWPDPVHATKCESGVLRALTEVQRREVHIAEFTEVENEIFLPVVTNCLENDPGRRPQMNDVVAHFEDVVAKHGGLLLPPLLDVEDDRCRLIQQIQVYSERINQLEQLTCQNAEQIRPVSDLPLAHQVLGLVVRAIGCVCALKSGEQPTQGSLMFPYSILKPVLQFVHIFYC